MALDSNYFGDFLDFLLRDPGFFRGILSDLVSKGVLLP